MDLRNKTTLWKRSSVSWSSNWFVKHQEDIAMRNVHYLIAEPLKRGQLEMKRHNEKLYSEVQNSFLTNWWSTQETEQCYPTLQSSANDECSWKPQLKAWVPGQHYWGCCEPPEGRAFGTSLDPWGDTSEGNNGTLANSFFSFASWCYDEQFVPANTPCRCYQIAYQGLRQRVHPILEWSL